MTIEHSADEKISSKDLTTDELQDPMSGYTSADVLGSSPSPAEETHGAERLRDPMSGYARGDALQPEEKTDDGDVETVHAEETKDSMSGYASADSLGPDQK